MSIIGTIIGTAFVIVGDALKNYGTKLLFPDGVPRIEETAVAQDLARAGLRPSQDDIDEPPIGVPPVVLSDAAKDALLKGSLPARKRAAEPEPVLKGSLKHRLGR